jgi:hypothetical protein
MKHLDRLLLEKIGNRHYFAIWKYVHRKPIFIAMLIQANEKKEILAYDLTALFYGEEEVQKAKKALRQKSSQTFDCDFKNDLIHLYYHR